MNVIFAGKGSIGPRYIMYTLKKSGHCAYGIFPSVNEDLIKKYEPQVVGFTTTTPDLDMYLEEAKEVKLKYPHIKVIFGGVHPTLGPEDVISHESVDFLCRGDGESATLELCNAIEKGGDITSIPNIWAKVDGKVHRNEMRPLEQDIDQFQIDREDFAYNGTFASRGCIGECTFCAAPLIKRITKGRYIRMRSVDNVVDEIRRMYGDGSWPAKNLSSRKFNIMGKTLTYSWNKAYYPFRFKDDNFALYEDWLEEFGEKFQKNFPGKTFMCQLRPDGLKDSTARLLKKAGCVAVSMGIECGSERVRNDVLGKFVSNDTIIGVGETLKKHGIKLIGQWIIGSPGETYEELMESVKLHAQLDDIGQPHIATPYPFTKMYEYSVKNGYMKPGDKISSSLYSRFYFHDKKDEIIFRMIYHLFPVVNATASAKTEFFAQLGFGIKDKKIIDLINEGLREAEME